MKRVFLQTLILNRLTSQILKPALILAKTITSDPYNGGLLKGRQSVVVLVQFLIFILLSYPTQRSAASNPSDRDPNQGFFYTF